MMSRNSITLLAAVLMLSGSLAGCGLAEKIRTIVQEVQSGIGQLKNLSVNEDELSVLLQQASASSKTIGKRLGTLELTQTGGGGSGGAGGLTAPRFRPLQSDAGSVCPTVSVSRTVTIEDYSQCSNQSGQVVYTLVQPGEENSDFRVMVDFTDYVTGTSDTVGYRKLNGQVIWSVFAGFGGFQIQSKEQTQAEYTKPATTGSGVVLVRTQQNNLWTYLIDFASEELRINATAAYTDLDSFGTAVLDFQGLRFFKPETSDCPTRAPVAGSASLSGNNTSVLIQVTGCAQGQIETTTRATDSTESNTELGELTANELEDIFAPAVEGFVDLIESIANSDFVGVVESGGGGGQSSLENCGTDPAYLSENVPPGTDELLGSWCTAWPVFNESGPDLSGPAWLDCLTLCVDASGVLRYERYGGVADGFTQIDERYVAHEPYYVSDFDRDGVADEGPYLPPADFQPLCRDFVWETGTWLPEELPGYNASTILAELLVAPPFTGSYPEGIFPTTTVLVRSFVESGGVEGDPAGGELVDVFEIVSDNYNSRRRLERWFPVVDASITPNIYGIVDLGFNMSMLPRAPQRPCSDEDYALVEAAEGNDDGSGGF